MDTANYVNKVGNLINEVTKYNVKLDRTNIINIILLNHLQDLLDFIEVTEEDIPENAVNKIKQYMLCLKKETSLYPEMINDTDCILTEEENHIIQE